jgi:PAS domain S-box-containing protein
MNSLCFIVDDDADTRENLRDILELEGYEVQEAGTAAELFRLSEWDRVAVVLLDRKLPDGSPQEVLPKIKRLAPNAGVIIVTGYGDVEGAVSSLLAGARDYIVKPIHASALLAVIARELERQKTAESLAQSEQRHHALFENAMDGFVILDADWRIVEANPAACTKLGMGCDEIIGASLEEFVGEHMKGILLPPTKGQQRRFAHACTLIRSDGIPIQVEYRVVTNFSPGLQLLSFHDVTDRKRAEERARQSERLAAIGETMAALVHESRNALQRSSACLEILQLELEDRPSALDLVARTQRAQEQLRQLYEEVRQWAAPIVLRREETDLAEVWREAWQYVVQLRTGDRPHLKEEIDGNAVCSVDRFVMEQVFRNIFENALEVTPPHGSVFVHCSNGMANGRSMLRVLIRDEGPGLTPVQQSRIFEPFFTTKSKGTGLGMALCHRIVAAHDGMIEATSPGGAQIEISLPKVAR